MPTAAVQQQSHHLWRSRHQTGVLIEGRKTPSLPALITNALFFSPYLGDFKGHEEHRNMDSIFHVVMECANFVHYVNLCKFVGFLFREF